MNKELQDLAWSVLPKEFKEVVKRLYMAKAIDSADSDAYNEGYDTALEMLFRSDNLISDAEGEEVFCVSRKKVQEMYATAQSYVLGDKEIQARTVEAVLDELFGSKCRPDEKQCAENAHSTSETKPAEPKFKVGDKVRIIVFDRHHSHGDIAVITRINKKGNKYDLDSLRIEGKCYCDLRKEHFEPYTEPQPLSQKTAENSNNGNHISANDNNERRLNIAVMMAQAILANSTLMQNVFGINSEKTIATYALSYADAIMDKSGDRTM